MNVIEYTLLLNDSFSGKLHKINQQLKSNSDVIKGSFREVGDSFRSGLIDKLEQTLPDPFKPLAQTLELLPPQALAAAGALGFIGSALVGLATVTLNAVNNVTQLALGYDKLAQKTGASVEFLSGFTQAADDVQISAESVNGALVKFADNLVQTKGTSANLEAELMALADRFAAMPDGPAKTALAIDAFGRAGAEMIPILNQGSEGIRAMIGDAQALGLVMSNDAVAGAKAMYAATDALADRVEGLKQQIGEGATPAVFAFVNAVSAAIDPSSTLEERLLANQAAAAAMRGDFDLANAIIAQFGSTSTSAAKQVLSLGSAAIEAGRMAAIAAAKVKGAIQAMGSFAAAANRGVNQAASDASRAWAQAVEQARTQGDRETARAQAYAEQSIEQFVGGVNAAFEPAISAAGGAGAAIKKVSDEMQALADRTNALKSALGQSTKPMGQVEQIQTAYAIATGEATVEQFEQEQAVKALLAALEQQKITQEQALTTVLAMREGLASSTDAFAVAGEAGATYKGEVDAVTGMVGTATGKISKMKDAIAALPKDTKVKVAADVYGIGDLRQARDMINSLSDRTVTITTIVRRIIQTTATEGTAFVRDDGTGGGGGGDNGKDKNTPPASVFVNTPVTVRETNPRKAAAYMAHVQRQAARQAALRAQAGFMG